jgi:hypothetical protein
MSGDNELMASGEDAEEGVEVRATFIWISSQSLEAVWLHACPMRPPLLRRPPLAASSLAANKPSIMPPSPPRLCANASWKWLLGAPPLAFYLKLTESPT